MANRSGFVALVQSVRTYLASIDVDAAVVAGFRRRLRQDNQGPGRANRVVFIPASLSGTAGSLEGVVRSGHRRIGEPATQDVRDLAIWNGTITTSVWACDLASKEDEEAQIEAVETLFEHVIQGIHYFGFGNVSWGDVAFTLPQERSFGLEILFSFQLRRPFRDRVRELAYPQPKLVRGGE